MTIDQSFLNAIVFTGVLSKKRERHDTLPVPGYYSRILHPAIEYGADSKLN